MRYIFRNLVSVAVMFVLYCVMQGVGRKDPRTDYCLHIVPSSCASHDSCFYCHDIDRLPSKVLFTSHLLVAASGNKITVIKFYLV